MELELKKEQFACYQALPQLSENREETTETIVPDYCPDIARIIETTGKVFLHSREMRDGRAEISGTVRVTVRLKAPADTDYFTLLGFLAS